MVIAAFNESRRIGPVVRLSLARFGRVIVVDDGSGDDTAKVSLAEGAQVIRHPVNLGQGAALQTGITRALETGADWIVTLDADGQHDPADAARLLSLARQRGWDVCMGSRFMGTAPGMPLSRRLLLKGALIFQRLTTGLALTDVHNGLRVLSRRAASTIELRQDRMAHASEFVTLVAVSGLAYGEGPVTIRYTDESLAKGQSAWGAVHIMIDLLLARLGR